MLVVLVLGLSVLCGLLNCRGDVAYLRGSDCRCFGIVLGGLLFGGNRDVYVLYVCLDLL